MEYVIVGLLGVVIVLLLVLILRKIIITLMK